MGLLLHLNITGVKSLPLRAVFPRVYPYTQMVNRVRLDEMDPFHTDLRCEKITDITALPSTTKSFADVAAERAIEYKKFDEPIYIMYSGGIDSTSAVLAFLQTWSDQELERVFILASHHSASEFSELWNVIVDKFGGRILPSFHHVEKYCRKGIVVTGEHGDQIFGSDVLRKIHHIFRDEGIHMPWQEAMPPVYATFMPLDTVHDFMDMHIATHSACPFPIKTAFDWVWWFNFTNKWQHVKYRMLAHKTWVDPQQNFKKIMHFYDTPAWQRWSLDNHDKKIGKTFNTYKVAAKDYIVSQTGFVNYLRKPKVGSLVNIWVNSTFYEAIDTDFNYITREQALEYVR